MNDVMRSLHRWSLPTVASVPVEGHGNRRWEVTVHGVQAVHMRSRGILPRIEWTLGQDQSVGVRMANQLAQRAVYALGGEAGVVTLIDRGMATPRFVVERWQLDALTDDARKESQVAKGALLFGADVEFVLQRTDRAGRQRVVPACAFFAPDAVVGCDGIRLRTGKKMLAIGEIRPQPATNPRYVYQEIARSIVSAMRHVATLDSTIGWLAGGMPVEGIALGGHVHLSGLPLTIEVLRTLDNYVALPLAMLEDRRTSLRRPAYGMLGSFRRKNHGGFEYRTLPSWLIAPDIAYGVLALTALTAHHIERLQQRPLHQEALAEAYHLGKKHILWPHVVRIWSELSTLPNFAQFSDPLDKLWQHIRTKQGWDELRDVRIAWGTA